jgi:hypothetical protein
VIAFLVDQNFNEHIVDGMTRRLAGLEYTYVREVGLANAGDSVILEWAVAHSLVLLTHDRKTIPPLAYARVAAGLPMPGVFLVSDDMPIGDAINELLIAVHCLSTDECKNIDSFRCDFAKVPSVRLAFGRFIA